MRAVTFSRTGGPDDIETIEVADATAGPGEVLIATEAATINPADYSALTGAFGERMPKPSLDDRWVTGWDLAGHITAVGDGVDASLVGKYVLAFSPWFAAANGTQAALVALPVENIAIAEESIAPTDLTTLGLNALTALQALDVAGVTAGTLLIVSGAAGGVGGFAVQLAAERGATVTGYASEKDRDSVLGFGASNFISREEGSLGGHGFDAAFDPAGAGAELLSAVKDGGVYVTPTQPIESERDISVKRVGVKPNKPQLEQLVSLAEQGKLAFRVAGTFDAAEAADAYRAYARPGQRGRTVITF